MKTFFVRFEDGDELYEVKNITELKQWLKEDGLFEDVKMIAEVKYENYEC